MGNNRSTTNLFWFAEIEHIELWLKVSLTKESDILYISSPNISYLQDLPNFSAVWAIEKVWIIFFFLTFILLLIFSKIILLNFQLNFFNFSVKI